MRNVFSLKIKTKISLTIAIMFAAIMLITVLKSVNSFDKFLERISSYEKLRVEKSK
jgi:hypothetical protein